MARVDDARWTAYLERYRRGERRSTIFRDMVLADAAELEREHGKLSILDIGCGGGFDSSERLQRSIAEVAGRYIGVEPDPAVNLCEMFTATYRCPFEAALLIDGSIDLGLAVMVLEHLPRPVDFWTKLHRVLRPGGVFWGFTVDARHWFVTISSLMDKLHVKNWYLNALHGMPGVQRYENYPVFYRCNTPDGVASLTRQFSSTTCLNFRRIGQVDYYLPRSLRWLGRGADRVSLGMGLPGHIMAVRVAK